MHASIYSMLQGLEKATKWIKENVGIYTMNIVVKLLNQIQWHTYCMEDRKQKLKSRWLKRFFLYYYSHSRV